jgi:hypothetical protein
MLRNLHTDFALLFAIVFQEEQLVYKKSLKIPKG